MPNSVRHVKSELKNQVKKSIKPKVSVDPGSILDTFENFDKEGSKYAGTLKTFSGSYKKDRTQRWGHHAGASVAEAGASYSVFGANATALSAGAGVEYGLHNSAYAHATVARASANAGPMEVGVGLSLDTGASIGVDGASIGVLGFGVSVGPKMAIKTPVADVSCSIM